MTPNNPKPTLVQWIKLAVAATLYIAFLAWVESWWGLIVLPFIFDVYITKKIRWSWWRDLENPIARTVMSWIDAIVFALVAVYFVNIFFFQNYTIPSSSLEKSLLVGDYLFVSKMSYGPRIPQTPLSMPLTQHTMPITGGKSYFERPQWDYRRVQGGERPKLNDIVVFNFPAGDTVVINENFQVPDFQTLCTTLGQERVYRHYGYLPALDTVNAMEKRHMYQAYYKLGHDSIAAHPELFGKIMWRPVDRRENYVKRCVGLPGQTLEIKNHIIYLDGKANKEPENVQYNYRVTLRQPIGPELAHELGISMDDVNNMRMTGELPLTRTAYDALKARTDIVAGIEYVQANSTYGIYPVNSNHGWSCDNYGPIWIPAKGDSIRLTLDNLAVYERPIRVYEGNTLDVTDDGTILINGKPATSYTFRMDYYWMQGDNRHNSLDSRYWGFVPEDHIVGKPILIWLSTDKDRGWFDGHIRWNRLFRWVDNIK